jgi:Fic family protein
MALFAARKMLPEYVFDTAQLEKNPITFPEVQTLIDGISIGGRRVEDVQQVLNIRDAWSMLLRSISGDTFVVNKEMFHAVNALIAREESLEWGVFRTGSVGIAGTEHYEAPPWQELEAIFDQEVGVILDCDNTIERAIRVFLWGALNQFYWDGNRRTARLMANGTLIDKGYGVFNIKAKDILEFNTLMLELYDTRKADRIMLFLAEKCIWLIEPIIL